MTATRNLTPGSGEAQLFADSTSCPSMLSLCSGHKTYKRRTTMFSIYRTLFTILFSISLVSGVFGQARRPNGQVSSPIVTATTSNGRVRYASLGEVNQSRLQVFSADGRQVYDSDLRLGNLIDWPLLDQQGQRLTDGSYAFLVTVREFSGNLTQKYGTALLDSDHVTLQQISKDEMPQAQGLALQANKVAEVLGAVDRIGAAALTYTPVIASEVLPVIEPAPSKKTAATTTTTTAASAPAGENLTGTGTQDRLAKWTDNAGTIGDSGITETASGFVGIGTATPSMALDVANGRIAVTGDQTLAAPGGLLEIGATLTNNHNQASGIRMRNTFNGNASIQAAFDLAPTFAPSTSISLARGFISTAFFAPAGGVTITDGYGGNANTVYNATDGAVTNGTAFAIRSPIALGSLKPTNQYGVRIHSQGLSGSTNAYGLFVDAQSGATNNYSAIFAGGNVGIGTATPGSLLDVNGNMNVTGNAVVGGNIAAKYQDVAEWVPASEQIEPGTLVTLDPVISNSVMRSRRAYDTRVAGVVSPQPGLILGEAGEGKVLVATTGRVKIRVDATRQPIKIGDLLVTSNVTGFAMKSMPVRVGGRQLHRPGTIVGKALEPLAKGRGEILILLSLQ